MQVRFPCGYRDQAHLSRVYEKERESVVGEFVFDHTQLNGYMKTVIYSFYGWLLAMESTVSNQNTPQSRHIL